MRRWIATACLVGGLLLGAACCPPAATTGPAWPKSAGAQGDIDRDEPDAWQQDGGTSVDPTDPDTTSNIENARLGPPPTASDDEDVAWGEVDWDEDDDEAVEVDGEGDDDSGATVDGGELVIEL